MNFCVDYRKLNAVASIDNHPLPPSFGAFDALLGSQYLLLDPRFELRLLDVV